MHEIKAWKTTDGKIFEAKDDAGSNQYALDVKGGLENILSTFYHPSMGMHEVIDELFRVRHSLREVLDNEKRGG